VILVSVAEEDRHRLPKLAGIEERILARGALAEHACDTAIDEHGPEIAGEGEAGPALLSRAAGKA